MARNGARILWMVVADAAEAAIYARDGLKQPSFVVRLRHPEAHLRDRDLITDRAGRANNDAGGSWSLAQATSAADIERDRFARVVAHEIESGHIAHRFSELALVMPPRFLGLVRGHLSTRTKEVIVATVDRRLSETSIEDVASRVAEVRVALP